MAKSTPLQTPYVFSFMRRGKAAKVEGGPPATGAADDNNAVSSAATNPSADAAPHPYENSIKTITQVATVEEFWATYDFLRRPNDLPTTTDYHFFRDNIKPTWEDPGNAKGGKWIIRLPKGLASRYWEEIILAMIGCQFTGVPEGEICGAVLSVRYSEDILGVWNRNAFDREMVDRIRDSIKKVLQLPAHANMEYKPHQASLQDRSSFRNTQVWKPSKGVERSHSRASGVERERDTRRSGSWSDKDKIRGSGGVAEARGSWRQATGKQ